MKPSQIIRALVPPRLRPARYIRDLSMRESQGSVIQGIFAGMRYSDAAVGSVYLPKVLGTYEDELYDTLEQALRNEPATIVDIGAAEGYYAVGLAFRSPTAMVTAWEMLAEGRKLIETNARLNGLLDRIEIRGECTVNELAESQPNKQPTLVICDVEGFEVELLDPDRVPWLRQSHVLVEMHDMVRPGATELIVARFTATHSITRIDERPRTRTDFPFHTLWLRAIPSRFVVRAVSDKRRVRMHWLWMEPR